MLLLSLAAGAHPTFQQFFKGSGSVMMLIEPSSGEIVEANSAAAKFYGYSIPQLQRMTIQQINQLTPEQVAEERRLAKSEGRNYFIFRHKLANDEVRTVEVHSEPYDFNGRTLLLSTIHDMTPLREKNEDFWHYQTRLENMVDEQRQELKASYERQTWTLVSGILIQTVLILLLLWFMYRRQKLQKSLNDVATMLTNIMNAATGVGIIATDKEGVITAFNHGAEKILGYRADEVVGKTTPLKFHDKAEVKAQQTALSKLLGKPMDGFGVFVEQLENNQHRESEWTYIRKDGSRLMVSLYTSNILNEAGDVVGYLGLAQDISELKTSQKALETARNELKATLDALPDLLFEVDLSGVIHSYHSSEADHLYVSPDVFLNKQVEEVLPEKPAIVIMTALHNAYKSGNSFGLQYALDFADGRRYYELSVSRKTPLDAAESPKFVVLARDISLRKRQERQLAEKDQRLNLILEASNIGQWDWDIVNDVMLWDARSYTMLGFKENAFQVSFEKWRQMLHPDDCHAVERLQAHLEDKDTYSVEYRLATVDNDWLWIESRGQVVERDDEGHPTRMVGMHMDVSDRKQVEDMIAMNEERLRTIFEILPIGISLTDRDGHILECNSASEKLLGLTREEHTSRRYDDDVWLIYREDGTPMPPDEYASVRALQDHTTVKNQVMEIRHTGGSTWLNVNATPLDHPQYGLVITYEDISDKRAAEARLNLAASVFTHAREGITITDKNGRIIDVNRGFTLITGYERDEVIGQNPNILSSGRQPQEFYNTMWKTLFEKGHWTGEMWNRHKDGSIYAQIITISAIQDANGAIQNYVGLFTDITSLKEQQQQLEHIAHYDVLTQLPNRTLLADRLSQAMFIINRRGGYLAVLFIDLDQFKAINDSFGHDIGDDLLVEVSKRMRSALREEDTLSRIGGDEFVAVLANLESLKDCEEILERLLKAASDPVHVQGHTLTVSASIGVTFYPEDQGDPDQLMRHADQAMYQAKQEGKNRYHYFDVSHDSMMKSQSRIQQEIIEAIDQDQFVLHFQPKVNIKEGRVIGAEALVRWQYPDRGLLLPGDFLPNIEGLPLSIELDKWVLRTALKQLNAWHEQGLHFNVSVNIGAYFIQHRDFMETLRDYVSQYPALPPFSLEVEILETSALEDVVNISLLIRECLELGVHFALDDFGTGYSSLTYLRHLPAQTVKIDQTFIRDMLVDPDDRAIVDGILKLAQAFSREVIAEGVETEAHFEALLKMGCELVQGYAIAKPMVPEALPDWVCEWEEAPECKKT
ncbi:PAS domain S-box protein [Thiomicrospira sp. XS5]|uniref:bifunctional diguanylate cyclase/phosphodiesterase n=1 Tax=Thiomicrospira sp. XS5 TaxID=1775636 RepID=UPI001F19348F|nr:PAS domain S-box protein [Thiomicrospira sp. XS5]